jgi:long-chain acyl-CoA synthetase
VARTATWEENVLNVTASAGEFASVPALLARNAAKFGTRPAYREKEYGIWQSWTWAETEVEVRNLALGFLALGVEKGDYIAIIGRNRPMLYWSMIASQMVGAVPVPLYQDSVAEEMAFVLDHCGARFVGDRRPGAGRQGDRGAGPRARGRAYSLRRSARSAEIRPHPTACLS